MDELIKEYNNLKEMFNKEKNVNYMYEYFDIKKESEV